MDRLYYLNTYQTLETTQTPEPTSQYKLPKVLKRDDTNTPIPSFTDSPLLPEISKSFYNNSKTPSLPYQQFRIHHQSLNSRLKTRKKVDSMVFSSIQTRLSRKSENEKLILKDPKKTISLKIKQTKRVQQKFGTQPKALPPAKAKLDYGIKITPAITFGDKLWRLTQLASLSFNVL